MTADGVSAATGIVGAAGTGAFALYQDSTVREKRALKKALTVAFQRPPGRVVRDELVDCAANPQLMVLKASNLPSDDGGLAGRVWCRLEECLTEADEPMSDAQGETPSQPSETAESGADELTPFEQALAVCIVASWIEALETHDHTTDRKRRKRKEAWAEAVPEGGENPAWVVDVVRRFSAEVKNHKVLRTSYATRVAAIDHAREEALREAEDGRIRRAQAQLMETASSTLVWTSRGLAVAIVSAVVLIGLDIASIDILDWIVDQLDD